MTTCIYLPDKTVAFMYARPHIDSNDAFDGGGMRFEVIEPFKELRVTYEGKVAVLTDPLAMADPRKAFTEAYDKLLARESRASNTTSSRRVRT